MLSARDKKLLDAAVSVGRKEVTVRSWTNGTRDINLEDFFHLCKKTGLDPAIVLFDAPLMTREQRQRIDALAKSVDSFGVDAPPEKPSVPQRARRTSAKLAA